MTKSETAKIMAVLKTSYPQYYRDMPSEELEQAVNLWQSMFADDDYKTVVAGIKSFLSTDTKGFPPSIGQVKEQIANMMRSDDVMSETTAWALVRKALRNSIYGYHEEFAKLPKTVQAAVGSPVTLHRWGQINEDTVDTVIASNFMRSYREQMRRERDYAKLPESVKLFAAEIQALPQEPKEQVYIDNYNHEELGQIIMERLKKEQRGHDEIGG